MPRKSIGLNCWKLKVKVTTHNYCRLIAPRFFRQNEQMNAVILGVFRESFGYYGEKIASEKMTKALAGNCAVLPEVRN